VDQIPALLSAEQLAIVLGVGLVTIYRWCRDGRLPCMKLGKVWRIRRGALEAFLRRAEQPQTLPGHLGAFLAVPDQVLAIAEDIRLLAQLDAAFFQVAEAHDGLLVKFHDPRITPRDALRARLRRNGLEIDRLEVEERFRWCPAHDPIAAVTSLRQLLDDEASAGRPLWVAFDWLGRPGLDAALRQQAELATLVAKYPLVIATSLIEPAVEEWPGAELQWRLLGSLRGVIRYARTGLLLCRVVASPEA
jgi:excisionase family DNA binding protein